MTELDFMTRLAQLRASNCEELPTPEFAVVSRAIERLRRAGYQDNCLQLGETVPDVTWGGEAHALYRALERGPVVLNFFRGFWCQYCKTEIEAYESVQAEMARLGATYLAVSPQRPETASMTPANYEIVFDRDNAIARQFGIVYQLDEAEQTLFKSWGLNLEEVHGSSDWELPIPATFIVTQNRRVGYQFVDVDFRARCCPEQLVRELQLMVAT